MKKFLALLMALALTLTLTAALAETPEPGPEAQVAPPLKIELNEDVVRSGVFPETQDKVTLENGVYTLETGGYTLKFQPPFGVLAFTQDMQGQLQDYLRANDGRAIAEYLISNNMSGVFLDPATMLESVLIIKETPISRMFVDSDKDFPLVLQTVQSLLLEGDEATEAQVGGKSFIRKLEHHDEGTFLLYYTLSAGKWVGLQTFAAEITPELDAFFVSILEGFTFP